MTKADSLLNALIALSLSSWPSKIHLALKLKVHWVPSGLGKKKLPDLPIIPLQLNLQTIWPEATVIFSIPITLFNLFHSYQQLSLRQLL